jgi:UDP-N-acetylglucosamine 2-epimerase (non-hydrolysing)
VLDAVLDLARSGDAPGRPDGGSTGGGSDLPGWDGPYGVVLLHRFELMQTADLAARTLAVLSRSSPVRLLLVADDHASHGMHDELAALNPGRVRVVPKQSHAVFSGLLAGASLVVTDSGGVQEEASLLGVPTLVHRRATERQDGLGRNVVLSGWDLGVLEQFLADPERHRHPPLELDVSPSDIVVEDLIRRGLAS